MLITLEGIDGSGKSSVWEALGAAYPDATLTREPTNTWYGDAVSRSVRDPEADPLAELFLYTADHAAHLAATVRPALAAGDLVVSDRYSDSRYAYQAASLSGVLDDPLAFVKRIHEPWTRPPDATLYLDVDPETGPSAPARRTSSSRSSSSRASATTTSGSSPPNPTASSASTRAESWRPSSRRPRRPSGTWWRSRRPARTRGRRDSRSSERTTQVSRPARSRRLR